jgi:micrococcal nuclease
LKTFYFLLLFPSLLCAQITKVTRVIDGDTFVIESGDKVRLIGINAPEISDIYGPEAKIHLQNLIEGKVVNLECDHISKDRDRYSRLLRYVILNGNDIDKQMLTDGFAIAYLKYHFDKSEEYRQAQLAAENYSAGMWHRPGNSYKVISNTNAKIDYLHKSGKTYFICGLVSILIVLGIYSRFKG